MSMFMYLLVAASFGWIASQLKPDRWSLLVNVLVAVAGTFLTGWLLTPLLHIGSIDSAINIPVPLLTAIVLLLVLNALPH